MLSFFPKASAVGYELDFCEWIKCSSCDIDVSLTNTMWWWQLGKEISQLMNLGEFGPGFYLLFKEE